MISMKKSKDNILFSGLIEISISEGSIEVGLAHGDIPDILLEGIEEVIAIVAKQYLYLTKSSYQEFS